MRTKTKACVKLPILQSPGFYIGSIREFRDASFELLREDKVGISNTSPHSEAKK